MAGFPEYSNEMMADKLGGQLIRKLVFLSMSAVRSDARFAGTTGHHCCDPCISHWRDFRPTQKLYRSKQSTQGKHSEECKQITLVDLKGPSTLISGGEGGWNQLEYNPKMDLNFGPYSAPEYTRVHWMHWSVMEYT